MAGNNSGLDDETEVKVHLSHVETESSEAVLADAGEVGTRLPLIEEILVVRKDRVVRGGLRITKKVTTRQETVDEPLVASHVTVERREIGEVVPGGVAPSVRTEGNTTIYPVLKEILVTEKRILLVAEVRITQIDTEYREPQTIDLRKEEVRVEQLADESTPMPNSLS